MKGISVEYPMYFDAKPLLFKLARELRREETEAEKIQWSKLKRTKFSDYSFEDIIP